MPIAFILPYIAAAGAVYGAVQANEGAKAADYYGRAQADQGRLAQGEQKAANAQAAAQERRNQIREERVRRARILQTSENTGTSGSSGEAGSLGALSTGLSSNIGSNLGSIQRANTLSDIGQRSADFAGAMREGQAQQQFGQSLFQMGTSIFSASGGFGVSKPPSLAPVVDHSFKS